MRDAFQKIDDGIAKYFRRLGYTVDWDFSRADHIEWYEISDDEGMFLQIDMEGQSIDDMIEDFVCEAAGRKGTSKVEYHTHCFMADEERYQKLVKRVAAEYKERTTWEISFGGYSE